MTMQQIFLAAGLAAGSAYAALPTYQSFGPHDKPTLVIVHGFPGNATDWYPVADRLSETFHVIVPDLLGFHQSQLKHPKAGDVWFDAQADRIINLLDSLEISKFSLIGHDVGTPISVMIAAKNPDRVDKLVISSGNILSDPYLNPMMKSAAVPVIGSVSRSFIFSRLSLNMMRTMGTKKGETFPVKNTRQERKAIKAIFGTALQDMQSTFMPVERMASELTLPVLLVYGEKDPFFPVREFEQMKEKLKYCAVLGYPEVGHYPFLEEELFVNDVTLFLHD
jgi:pimeloyl-ACP methyl ester carboxylesterase